MRLAAYRLKPYANIRPAMTKRMWMDEWPKRHPYHCWPLTVTNAYGWEMVCGSSFTASWNGGSSSAAITITRDAPACEPTAHSHFGYGILTFFTGCLIRTERPYQLFVTGPLNQPKHGVSPLSAIVETTWLPYTFAMSYAFTEPGASVRFEAGEPFCQFFPLDSRAIELAEPEWRDLQSDNALWHQYQEWRLARRLSMNALAGIDAEPYYQHDYQHGTRPSGEPLTSTPPLRYIVRDFRDRTIPTPETTGVDSALSGDCGHA
jgi:hypothetical protein